jgi:hypothetical protein
MKARYLYNGLSFNHSVNRLNCLHTHLKRNRRTYLVISVTSLIQRSLVQHWIRRGEGGGWQRVPQISKEKTDFRGLLWIPPITNTYIFGQSTFGQCLDGWWCHLRWQMSDPPAFIQFCVYFILFSTALGLVNSDYFSTTNASPFMPVMRALSSNYKHIYVYIYIYI